MSTYLKRTSAFFAAALLAIAVGFGLASAQNAYAAEGGETLTAAGLQTQSSLQTQAYAYPDVVTAPLVDHATDGTETAVDPEDYKVSCEVYYTSRTKNTILNPDGTPKKATIEVSATQLQKHKNAEGAEAYWVGVGLPAAEGNTYAMGFGDAPENPELSADNKTSSFEKDGKTYDTFYFGTASTFSDKKAYVIVKNAEGNTSVYNVDLSDVYTDAELSRGIYEVSGLDADTGMINLDADDAKTYIKVDNGQAKLLVRVYNANKYDYIYMGGVDSRPESSATDQMIEGIPVPADADYIANGAKKSQIFTDKDGVLGAAGMKYKAMYFELPITQADIAAKKVIISLRRSSWGPSKPGEWMGEIDHYFTFTGCTKVEDENGLVDGSIENPEIIEAIEKTNLIPLEPGAGDMQAYVTALTEYGELDYSDYDIDRLYLDMFIPECAKKLNDADAAIPNVVPEDGTYLFTQTLESYNYPSIAEGLYSDSLYSGVLKVENGKMTITVAQRRGSYEYMYLGFPTEAKAERASVGGDFTKMANTYSYQNESTVYLDHALNTIGPDGSHDVDTAGNYGMYTATFELKSLEKPIMISWISGPTSSWYNRSFIFHAANMGTEKVVTCERQIRGLLNYPNQDDPNNVAPLYRIDPSLVTSEQASAIKEAKATYDAMTDAEKASVDSTIIEPGTQSYGRVLENAVWALDALSATDNSTTLANGHYTGKFKASSSAGKSTTKRDRTWSVTKLTAANGKLMATITSDQSKTFTAVKTNGKEYANKAAEGANSQFEIPVAINKTISFVATSSAAKTSIAYQLTIAKGASSISLANQSKTFTGKALAYSGKVTKSGSTGKVTYAYYSDAQCKKSVKAADVKNAGTYYVKASVAADANYKAATSAAAKLTVAKANNTLVVKAKAKAINAKAKKATTVKAAKAFKVSKNASKGTVTYKLTKVPKAAKKYIKVAKNGKITIKKGLEKGKTYIIKVKASSKATANYKAATSKVISLKIKVK